MSANENEYTEYDNVTDFVGAVLTSMEKLYYSWHPTKEPDVFQKLVLPLFRDTSTTGLVWERKMYAYFRSLDPEVKDDNFIQPADFYLLVGAAYLAEGTVVEAHGEIARGWSLIARGNYWMGLAAATEVTKDVINGGHTQARKNAAKVRDMKYEPLRELAEKMARTNKYKSRRDAAIKIKPSVLKLAKEIGVSMSEDQAIITIGGWLKERGISFASKRTTSSSKTDTPSR